MVFLDIYKFVVLSLVLCIWVFEMHCSGNDILCSIDENKNCDNPVVLDWGYCRYHRKDIESDANIIRKYIKEEIDTASDTKTITCSPFKILTNTDISVDDILDGLTCLYKLYCAISTDDKNSIVDRKKIEEYKNDDEIVIDTQTMQKNIVDTIAEERRLGFKIGYENIEDAYNGCILDCIEMIRNHKELSINIIHYIDATLGLCDFAETEYRQEFYTTVIEGYLYDHNLVNIKIICNRFFEYRRISLIQYIRTIIMLNNNH